MKTSEQHAGALVGATLRQARRLVVFVLGTTVLLLGVVMLFTPGPAVVFIPLGLGILAVEFAWARRLLRRFQQRIRDAAGMKTPKDGGGQDFPMQEEASAMNARCRLSHTVLFRLRDNSPQARDAFLEACLEQLRGHDGEVFFAAGKLADDIAWDISDRDFDVIVQIVFVDKAAHDAYQESPRHVRFLEERSGDWTAVRAIDAYVG